MDPKQLHNQRNLPATRRNKFLIPKMTILIERTNKAKGKDKEVAEKGSAGKRKGAFDDNKIGGGRKRNNFDVETLQVPGLLKIRHIGQTTLRSAAPNMHSILEDDIHELPWQGLLL
ncbi:hypothetical protein JHK86_031532 [Glycine max]|nr:hypothetical protein JHK86_031532 [Glycine max]